LGSPEYAARKHHVPAPVGRNAADVAIPPVTGTALPTGLPAEQPLAPGSGPHAKKLTVPVGVTPVTPATVALSVFELPSVMLDVVGVVFVVELAAVTVKHSVLLPSADGE
jgi:hypothetical protein